MGVVLSWWLLVEALGIAALPLTATLLANLPDRGWAFARPVAILATAWLIWFPLASISALPYSRWWILATLVGFAAGNAALLRRPALRATLRRMLAREWGYALTCEVIFAGSFALMAWLRSFTPAVVDTEKFMDVAFISSLWRTPHLPAPDPWLSGVPINYYYFGHFLIATLAKLLGTQPGTAFNVGIALIFALAAVAVFGAAANTAAARLGPGTLLRRAAPAGIASVLLVLVFGNLNGAQVWWQDARAAALSSPTLHGNPWAWWLHRELWPTYEWWPPSRVIPNTINEFPAFSFVLADLHAHILALPFCALAVGIALNVLLARGQGLQAFGRAAAAVLPLITAAVLVGALYAINGWDLPTYLGLVLLALAIQQWNAHHRQLNSVLLVNYVTVAALFSALCFLLYLPFYRGFVSPSEGIGLVAPADRSPIGDELAIFGLPIFIVASLLVARSARAVGAWISESIESGKGDDGAAPGWRWKTIAEHPYALGGVLTGAALAALLLWTRATNGNLGWTLLWCLLTILACAVLAVRGIWKRADADEAPKTATAAEAPAAERWVYVLAGTAAALVAMAEVIFLRDIFGTRMNTVFKLYFQAWLLLSIAAGPALVWLAPAVYRAIAGALASAFEQPGFALAPKAHEALALASTAEAAGGRGSAGGHFSARTAMSETAPQLAPGMGEFRAEHVPEIPRALRWAGAGGMLVWATVLVMLVCAALIYPVLATSARTDNFGLSRGLDGTAYMASDPAPGLVGCQVAGGTNHNDNVAISWLNTHVQGSPVLVEAPGCEWGHYSRISAFTGLPTLLGWPGGHEGEWRTNWLPEHTQGDIFAQRQQDIATIYTNSDPNVVMAVLKQYSARFVYVGAAERALYANADLSRFGNYLQVIYNKDGVTIYETPY